MLLEEEKATLIIVEAYIKFGNLNVMETGEENFSAGISFCILVEVVRSELSHGFQ